MREKVAAYHEAGHAVLAAASRFHAVADDISVYDAYAQVFVALCEVKVRASGRDPADLKAVRRDPEVAAESFVLLAAGPAARDRYCREAGVDPDPAPAGGGPVGLAADAALRATLPEYLAAAGARVGGLWPAVAEFAEELFRRKVFDRHDAVRFIGERLPKG